MASSEFHPFWISDFGGSLDVAANAVLTDRDLQSYKQSKPMLLHLAGLDEAAALRVLDFGCGMGRCLYHGSKRFPNWLFVGYDNEVMLSRVPFVWSDMPASATWSSDWLSLVKDAVEGEKSVDLVYADLVFQHVGFHVLRQRLSEMRLMLRRSNGRLLVHGRRTLDDLRTNLWPLVMEYFDLHFAYGGASIESLFAGESNEHSTAMFKPKVLP